jgi:hypothetical protein
MRSSTGHANCIQVSGEAVVNPKAILGCQIGGGRHAGTIRRRQFGVAEGEARRTACEFSSG